MTSRDYLRQSTLPSPTITSIQTAIELQSGESLRDIEVIPVSLKFEEEIRRIRYEEGLNALGEYFQANPTHRSCVEMILTLTHRMLGLIHFYTASEKEVKCWCLRQGKTILESSAVVDVNITRYGSESLPLYRIYIVCIAPAVFVVLNFNYNCNSALERNECTANCQHTT